jgi:hypothetical protein
MFLTSIDLETLDLAYTSAGNASTRGAPGGQFCNIDGPDASPARPAATDPPPQSASRDQRAGRAGRCFQIIKIYYAPEELAVRCADAGFAQVTRIAGTYFFGLIAQ